MNTESGNLDDALKIPAIIAGFKKVQVDCIDSLKILHGYFVRNQNSQTLDALTAQEDIALSEVIKTLAKQSIDGIFLYWFAHQAWIAGGTFTGQITQMLVSINLITAPRKQFIKPGEWIIKQMIAEDNERAEGGSKKLRCKLSYCLGKVADWTGYHTPAMADQITSKNPFIGSANEPPIKITIRSQAKRFNCRLIDGVRLG